MKIKLQRVYDDQGGTEGYRILVDRVWPRGITKESLHLHEWLRELAPSTDLRKWFGHEPSKWASFRKKYLAELSEMPGELGRLRAIARKKPLVLLYSARDEERNQAVVIREALTSQR